MQPDSIVRIGGSLVQHGPANDRVYLMTLDPADMPGIVAELGLLGDRGGYGKLFAKVSTPEAARFGVCGYVEEARIPAERYGEPGMHFMCKYLDADRSRVDDPEGIADVLALARGKAGRVCAPERRQGPVPVPLGPEHCESLVDLYSTVFKSYPFPITDMEFLRRAMQNDVFFFGLVEKDDVVAAASFELDRASRCAEMTDFATLAHMRGRGAAGRLLQAMHARAVRLGVRTTYTIARAKSAGINVVFARAGYIHGGTLYNNTHISGRLESMNVWYKHLVPERE